MNKVGGSIRIGLPTLIMIAVKDLRKEFLLSSCLVVALAGVVAPLLLLFGLKSGVIETLRSRLVNDPVFREIKPEETRIYSLQFFDTVNQFEETAFAIGSVTKGASVIRLDSANNDSGLFIDMLPSGPGDPLLLDYDVVQPGPGEIVISHPVAESQGLAIADTVNLVSSRTESGVARQATAEMRIVGVLPVQADVVERVYVPLQFAVDVESFREGFEVASRDWKGSSLQAKPVYHGVIAALNKTLSRAEQQRAINNTGFFNVNDLESAEFEQRFLFEPPEHVSLYEISVIDNPAQESAVKRLRSRLSGFVIEQWPYVEPMPIEVQTADNQWTQMRAISSPLLSGNQVALPETMADSFVFTTETEKGALFRINSLGEKLVFKGTVVKPLADATNYPATVNPVDTIVLSPYRMGILLQAQDRLLQYVEADDRFINRPLGFRGFRIFAHNINDVESLSNKLEKLGVPSRSSVQEILRLKALDNGLNSLFSVIAILGIATGIIVFLASQYSAVERKRSSLAHLRLMGLSRQHVASIPMFQGLLLALLGAALGALLTYLISGIVNQWFARPLGFEGQVSVIRPITIVIASVSLLILSVLASSGAAVSATAIDPADGMRDE